MSECVRTNVIEYRNTDFASHNMKPIHFARNKEDCKTYCKSDNECKWWRFNNLKCSHIHDEVPDVVFFKPGSYLGKVECKYEYDLTKYIWWYISFLVILMIGIYLIMIKYTS